MPRICGYLLLASLAILLPLGAQAAPGLSVSLKNYYTDYEIVVECSGKAHLTAEDAAAAKSAIAKIEAHYLNRDPSINKEGLLKQAVSNKNAAFKMVKGQKPGRSGPVLQGVVQRSGRQAARDRPSLRGGQERLLIGAVTAPLSRCPEGAAPGIIWRPGWRKFGVAEGPGLRLVSCRSRGIRGCAGAC